MGFPLLLKKNDYLNHRVFFVLYLRHLYIKAGLSLPACFMIPAWWLQGSAVWCLHCSSAFLKRCDRREGDRKSVCPVPQTCLPSKTWSSVFCETEYLGLGGEQGLGSNPDTEWQQLGNLFWVSVSLHQFDVNVSTLTLMCRDHCNEMLLMRISEELWGWLMAKSIGCPCREPEPGSQHWQWEFYICLGLQLQRMCHLPSGPVSTYWYKNTNKY